MNDTNVVPVFGKVDSVDFAVYLSQKAIELNKSVNVTKLQKWLYICYGLYFAFYGEQLLTERPKAWEFGPVFPKVYNKQRKRNTLNDLPIETSLGELKQYDEVIRVTLENFGDWTASQLVAWTHEKGKAWDKTYNHFDARNGNMDNNDIIKDFEGMLSNG